MFQPFLLNLLVLTLVSTVISSEDYSDISPNPSSAKSWTMNQLNYEMIKVKRELKRSQMKLNILEKEMNRRQYHIRNHNHKHRRIPIEDHYSDAWIFHFVRNNRSMPLYETLCEHSSETQPILLLYITKYPTFDSRQHTNVPGRMAYKLTRGVSVQEIQNPYPGIRGLMYSIKLVYSQKGKYFEPYQECIKIKDYWIKTDAHHYHYVK